MLCMIRLANCMTVIDITKPPFNADNTNTQDVSQILQDAIRISTQDNPNHGVFNFSAAVGSPVGWIYVKLIDPQESNQSHWREFGQIK